MLPHVLAEASNLARAIPEPARSHICSELAAFIEANREAFVASNLAARHASYAQLGLTDAVILVLCREAEQQPTLLTADQDLAIEAEMAGFPVLNFEHLRD